MKVTSIRPELVQYIPRELEEGVFYISRQFGTASHLCCCGCGTKIVTPLRETEYRLVEEPAGVSLYPSVGNWDHPCESHYVIRRNRVIDAGKMTPAEIARGRARDETLKAEYFGEGRRGWIERLFGWLAGFLRRLFG